MKTIIRTATYIILGIGACIALASPVVGAMILALSLFPDSPTDAVPTMIVVGGIFAGMGVLWLYSVVADPFIPSNRDWRRETERNLFGE